MPIPDDQLKKAFKAFKKKLKMQQLEEDSRLGRSPLTGAKTNVVAIQPPPGYSREVWEELKSQGYLKADGGGFFAIGDKQFS